MPTTLRIALPMTATTVALVVAVAGCADSGSASGISRGKAAPAVVRRRGRG